MKLTLSPLALLITGVLVLGAPTLASAQHAADLGGLVKASAETVREHFGAPDAVAYSEEKDAEVWTYYRSTSSVIEPAQQLLSVSLAARISGIAPDAIDRARAAYGFTQFAFWNGRVAALTHVESGPDAAAFYDASVGYLEEHAAWVGLTTMGDELDQITRIGDDVWMVDRTPVETGAAQAVLRVGDAGYIMCPANYAAERERVKEQFGLDLLRKR